MNKVEVRINGPKVFGVRPGHPFLYHIPATGPHPRSYGAKGLPKGLDLNPATGRISGKVNAKGSWNAELSVKTSAGLAKKAFKIVCGEEICLTPPLGWNSWNCWGWQVSQEKVLKSARAMASTLKDHGWTYINIDDGWQGLRASGANGKFAGALLPNEKFPNMAALCKEVHSLGLKVGIYSTPWVSSYAGFAGGSSDNKNKAWSRGGNYPAYVANWRHGKFAFDKVDAKQWAAWGIDYLKYDWHPNDVATTRRMAQALRASGRDIVLSLSNTAPLEHAAELSQWANCWRTTGDIHNDGVAGHVWERGSLTVNNYHGVKDIWRFHHLHKRFQRPGHWPDADMLVLGKIGWGDPKPTPLSKDQQRTHFTAWALFASPLLLGCPLDEADPFTLSLLTNDEVLEVHQDSLGIHAWPMVTTTKPEIWSKPLEDGSMAVGLFNPHYKEPKKLGILWADLKLSGKKRVRDLWKRKDLGTFKDGFSATVPGHGVLLLKIHA